MNNNIDRQYKELVEHILRFGNSKSDRTGTGTKSIFGWQIRHSMKDGFPLITTKKMAFKTMVIELLWFLKGMTNIKYLVDNGCHIWDGDAWANYEKKAVIGDVIDSYYEPATDKWHLYNKEEFIDKIKKDERFAKKWGELGPIYGAGWRRWKKPIGIGYTGSVSVENFIFGEPGVNNGPQIAYDSIDQIANVINLLKTDPDSRRMIVNAWNVGELDQMVLPPCHMMFQFYTRELTEKERYKLWFQTNYETGMEYNENEEVDYENNYYTPTPKRAISLRWDQRSNDIGLGNPMNIGSYSLLLMIIAKQVNMIPEEVIGHLGDCHIYNNHVDGLKEQLTRIPYELPTVKISDRIVNDISEYTVNDFTLENYVSHPKIYLPLSN